MLSLNQILHGLRSDGGNRHVVHILLIVTHHVGSVRALRAKLLVHHLLFEGSRWLLGGTCVLAVLVKEGLLLSLHLSKLLHLLVHEIRSVELLVVLLPIATWRVKRPVVEISLHAQIAWSLRHELLLKLVHVDLVVAQVQLKWIELRLLLLLLSLRHTHHVLRLVHSITLAHQARILLHHLHRGVVNAGLRLSTEVLHLRLLVLIHEGSSLVLTVGEQLSCLHQSIPTRRELRRLPGFTLVFLILLHSNSNYYN